MANEHIREEEKKKTPAMKKNPNLLEMLLYLSGKDKKKKNLFSSGIVFGAKCQKIPRAVFSERPCSQAPFLIFFFFPKTMIKLPHTALFFFLLLNTPHNGLWLFVLNEL